MCLETPELRSNRKLFRVISPVVRTRGPLVLIPTGIRSALSCARVRICAELCVEQCKVMRRARGRSVLFARHEREEGATGDAFDTKVWVSAL
jgi:hypothetical protein